MILVRGQAFSVVEHPSDIPIHKITDHSGEVEEGVDLFLRDLIASDRSRATIKAYAFVLCAWLNFLGSRAKSCQSAAPESWRLAAATSRQSILISWGAPTSRTAPS